MSGVLVPRLVVERTSGGKPDAPLWANKFDHVTNDSIGSITAFLGLRCGSYNLKFVHTPGLEGGLPCPLSRTHIPKKLRASESRSRISTDAGESFPKGP